MNSTSDKTNSLTMTIEETARALGISRGLAYDLARQNKLPGVLRLGRRMVVSRKAFERFLEDGTNGSIVPPNKAR